MRLILLAAVLAAQASSADPAAGEEDCARLLREVTDQVSQDPRILAQVRAELERAAALCEDGRAVEANAILREVGQGWMPMGKGN